MNIDRAIQLATLVSVIVGVGLVIWELRQAHTLSRAQLTSDSLSSINSVYLTASGENLSAALETACLKREELTLKESIEINAYYFSLLNVTLRVYHLAERDGIYPSGYWQRALGNLLPILASEYGQIWFRERSNRDYPQELLDAGLALMDEIDPKKCLISYERRTGGDA